MKKLFILVVRKVNTTTCPDCHCAESPTPPPITNFTLRKDLQPGDIISNASGATRFILKTVVPQSDGVYKGLLWFWMEIWNVKFLCEYWDLSVNTDNVMIGGDYESVYNPQFLLDVDAAKNFMDSLANAIAETGTNTNIKDTIKLDIPIESIYIDADGNIVVVSTNPDGSTTETVLTPDGELNNTVVQDADGNVYVVDENNGTQNVAQEFTGYGMQENIIISEENIKTIKNQIIVELIDSIKSKIDINAYSGTNRKYLEGAINQTDYIINNTNIVTYSNMGAVGWYEEGKLYIMYTGNETKDDVKATLFHEYLHHINYLYKFFPYRYSNEDRRDIYVKEDSCFYFGKKTLQGIYGDFILTLGYRVVDENWPDKYSDLEENQKQEVLAYKEQNKDQYNKEICTLGIYRPSNYYRDELSVYEICLTLDGILFNISESKKSIYFDNKSKYEEAIQLSVKFENNNNIKEDGYEK